MIQELINDLDFGNSKNTQLASIKKIMILSKEMSDDDISNLIKFGNKFTWPNTIKILSQIGYPRIKKSIPNLLFLMQDLNWPGSLDAQDLLKTINFQEYRNEFEEAIYEAISKNDVIWVYNLMIFVFELEGICRLELTFSEIAIKFICDNNKIYGTKLMELDSRI